MRLVEFTQNMDEKRVYVNADRVNFVREDNGTETSIFVSGDPGPVTVNGSVMQVIKKLDPTWP